MAELGPTARIVWTLTQNHTWGQPIPEEDVIALATKDEDGDEMRAALDTALELSFLSAGPQWRIHSKRPNKTRGSRRLAPREHGAARIQNYGDTLSIIV